MLKRETFRDVGGVVEVVTEREGEDTVGKE